MYKVLSDPDNSKPDSFTYLRTETVTFEDHICLHSGCTPMCHDKEAFNNLTILSDLNDIDEIDLYIDSNFVERNYPSMLKDRNPFSSMQNYAMPKYYIHIHVKTRKLNTSVSISYDVVTNPQYSDQSNDRIISKNIISQITRNKSTLHNPGITIIKPRTIELPIHLIKVISEIKLDKVELFLMSNYSWKLDFTNEDNEWCLNTENKDLIRLGSESFIRVTIDEQNMGLDNTDQVHVFYYQHNLFIKTNVGAVVRYC